MKTQNQKPATTNRPIRTLRHAGVSASVWANQSDKGLLYSVTFQRSYKEKGSDEWKTTNSFGRNQLLLLSLLASRAFEYIIAQPNGANKSA